MGIIDLPEDMLDVVTLVLPRHGQDAELAATALTAFERDVLPAYLPAQRWFADKDAGAEELHVVDAGALGDAGAQLYFSLVRLTERERTVFLPLAIAEPPSESEPPERDVLARVRLGERDALLYDGFAVDAFVRALLDDVIAERQRHGMRGGTFAAHATQALREMRLPAGVRVRRMNVEQSNTSVVVDERVILKGYRRANPGPQPELEVARFLDAVGYRNTPQLLGYVEYERPGAETTALAILQRFAENEGDAWSVTLRGLERIFAQGAPPDEAGERAARMLGVRTAELHRAFATPCGDAAFEPEPVTPADLDAWAAQARETAEAALDGLARERERVPPELGALVDRLLGERDAMLERFRAHRPASPLMKTRYHGDYHLGQVLVAGGDFLIVDFEGEPGRDLAVRRRKSSPLRDVAGMVRSIDYAAVAGLFAERERRPADADALEEIARDWQRRTTAAFLAGYRETMAGCPSYPSDPDDASRLLDLFLLEKAFYEVSYELANRPSWLRIPLEGIRAILDGDRSVAR